MENEKALQRACITYLRANKRVLFCHVPNEITIPTKQPQNYALRNFRYQQGVSKGVPDLLIFNCNQNFNGLAIELKAKRNKPTPAQLLWLEQLNNQGWFACWANNFDTFVKLVEAYLNTPNTLLQIHNNLKNNQYLYLEKN